jgi:hypothetical protein
MEIAVQAVPSELTLGPVLFNWQPEDWRDFYFRIADEAPIATVYLGEVICFKRAPLFEPYRELVAARLTNAGKTVVRSTLAEVMSKQERKLVDEVCAGPADMVEANGSRQTRDQHRGAGVRAASAGSFGALLSRARARADQGQLPVHLQ